MKKLLIILTVILFSCGEEAILTETIIEKDSIIYRIDTVIQKYEYDNTVVFSNGDVTDTFNVDTVYIYEENNVYDNQGNIYKVICENSDYYLRITDYPDYNHNLFLNINNDRDKAITHFRESSEYLSGYLYIRGKKDSIEFVVEGILKNNIFKLNYKYGTKN